MKIGVLTIHIGFNFGSSLQTIATNAILSQLGYEVLILNYFPPRVTYKRFFNNMISSLKGLIRGLLAFPNFVMNRRIYYSYLNDKVKLSKAYYSEKDFINDLQDIDYYIVGSDQVWNSKHNEGVDQNYFFSFLPKQKKIFSFASSFGREELPVEEFNLVKSLLNRFDNLSIREKSGQRILESMGYKAEHLLDPTFLLTKESWKDYMSLPLIQKPYLLVYTPYNTISKETIFKTARLIAQDRKLKLVTFSWNYLPNFSADKTIFYANPSDFLSLIYHAEYIITNSFHGTAFSINLNKQFWVYNPSVFSTRIDSLLDLFNLNSRKLVDIIEMGNLNEIIDYDNVNNILEEERNKTLCYLSKALNS